MPLSIRILVCYFLFLVSNLLVAALTIRRRRKFRSDINNTDNHNDNYSRRRRLVLNLHPVPLTMSSESDSDSDSVGPVSDEQNPHQQISSSSSTSDHDGNSDNNQLHDNTVPTLSTTVITSTSRSSDSDSSTTTSNTALISQSDDIESNDDAHPASYTVKKKTSRLLSINNSDNNCIICFEPISTIATSDNSEISIYNGPCNDSESSVRDRNLPAASKSQFVNQIPCSHIKNFHYHCLENHIRTEFLGQKAKRNSASEIARCPICRQPNLTVATKTSVSEGPSIVSLNNSNFNISSMLNQTNIALRNMFRLLVYLVLRKPKIIVLLTLLILWVFGEYHSIMILSDSTSCMVNIGSIDSNYVFWRFIWYLFNTVLRKEYCLDRLENRIRELIDSLQSHPHDPHALSLTLSLTLTKLQNLLNSPIIQLNIIGLLPIFIIHFFSSPLNLGMVLVGLIALSIV